MLGRPKRIYIACDEMLPSQSSGRYQGHLYLQKGADESYDQYYLDQGTVEELIADLNEVLAIMKGEKPFYEPGGDIIAPVG